MIEKRENGTYRVRVYHRSRYVGSRTFRRLTDARVWERQQSDALASGTWVSPAAGSITVREWLDVWMTARRQTKRTSTRRIEGLIRNHIVPKFGRRPLTSVAPSEVSEWAQTLAAQRSPSTARQALGVVRQAYSMAVRDGRVARNPTVGIKLPRTQRNEPRPLTHAQVWKLAEAVEGSRDRLLILVMAYGGLRWGEATALTRANLRSGGLRLTHAMAETNKPVRSSLKDWEARDVPLPDTVYKELTTWAASKGEAELLFGTSTGTALRNSNWRRRIFDPACSSLGLAITPHNLRDTAASLAIAAGASVVAVARLLGHEDASTTLRHYAGLLPNDLDQIALKLDVHARKEATKHRVA